jgi:hypothetical protein
MYVWEGLDVGLCLFFPHSLSGLGRETQDSTDLDRRGDLLSWYIRSRTTCACTISLPSCLIKASRCHYPSKAFT